MNGGDATPSFLDTNILVYALAKDDPARSAAAQQLLRDLRSAGALRTSVQVLQELYVTLTRKMKRDDASKRALRYMDWLAASPVFETDYAAVRAAAALSAAHSIAFWDALIIVAAVRSGATVLYSEDLQHGRTIGGVRIVNPFRTL